MSIEAYAAQPWRNAVVDSLIAAAVVALLIPPGLLVVVLLVALAFAGWRPRAARIVILIAALALYCLSIPCVSSSLLQLLQAAPLDPGADGSGQAIVVIGGGMYLEAPEYGSDTVNDLTLVRVRYAAHLYRLLGKPLLASGGPPASKHPPESFAMRQLLEREFQVPVTWVEERSRTTLENARRSFQLLGSAGVTRIYLVTHAWHMPRARFAFESAGFEVIPAPTAYVNPHPINVSAFVPTARAMLASAWFFHEAIGIGWYHLRVASGH